ncbi:unnamed protein product [Eretmochelys imbricata]
MVLFPLLLPWLSAGLHALALVKGEGECCPPPPPAAVFDYKCFFLTLAGLSLLREGCRGTAPSSTSPLHYALPHLVLGRDVVTVQQGPGRGCSPQVRQPPHHRLLQG